MTCVHDPWYRDLDRIALAVLVAFMVAIAGTQAYQAGQRQQAKKDKADMDYYMTVARDMEDRALKNTTFKAGWDSCMEQF